MWKYACVCPRVFYTYRANVCGFKWVVINVAEYVRLVRL